MKKNITRSLLALFTALSLSSCIIQQAVYAFVREEYPGPRPPKVITDAGGKPASNDWIQVNPHDLPPSSLVDNASVSYGDEGIPYGFSSEFSDIVVSPHEPHYQLDYTGVSVGAKVWDPYTRKPFYIPRAYSFN